MFCCLFGVVVVFCLGWVVLVVGVLVVVLGVDWGVGLCGLYCVDC